MTTLVIPDIHNHTDSAEQQIGRYAADQVVLLGDYFDNIGDTPEIARRTAEWLNRSLRDPKRIHLWGNHDLAYAFPEDIGFFCPGYTVEKHAEVSQVLNWKEHWSKLKLVHFVGDFALSHAGISRDIFGENPTQAKVEAQCLEAMDQARLGDAPHEGVFANEGIVWQRWFLMDCLSEFHQIVGHTPMEKPGIEMEKGRLNVCLDTYGRYIGWIEDGELSIIDTHKDERRILRAE